MRKDRNRRRMRALCGVLALVAAIPMASGTAAAGPRHGVVDAGSARSAGGATCRGIHFPVTMSPDEPAVHRVFARLCARGRPTARTPVQILLHGGSYDHSYWDWPYRPNRYSYVRHATRRGFATLNVDRLGYGRSDRPDPRRLDFRVAGYVTHQLVRYLRAGALGVRFRTVVLNGHSMGGITAEHAAAHGGVDAMIISGLAPDRAAVRGRAEDGAPVFHPAEQDPKFACRNWPAGYFTTVPGTRAEMFLAGGDYDPAIVPYEEALKDTLTAAELRAVGQDPGPAAARTAVPAFYVLGQYDRIACRTGDCRTDPAGRSADRIIADTGHSINTSGHAGAFYRATFRWLARLGIR
ncbi:alpha/beta hydrolase [Amycolatopsis aidingensis]|uniref:alpha/beta hydrolase n=1 Tax=Amycolatopsis aidingensis TaxID=2842453 RepID=UPI001C0CE100|nr:alpha/beta hydrolase [Amycolatopsis aidingensis]